MPPSRHSVLTTSPVSSSWYVTFMRLWASPCATPGSRLPLQPSKKRHSGVHPSQAASSVVRGSTADRARAVSSGGAPSLAKKRSPVDQASSSGSACSHHINRPASKKRRSGTRPLQAASSVARGITADRARAVSSGGAPSLAKKRLPVDQASSYSSARKHHIDLPASLRPVSGNSDARGA